MKSAKFVIFEKGALRYVILLMLVYNNARNYSGIKALEVRYYVVRHCHIGLMSCKLRKNNSGPIAIKSDDISYNNTFRVKKLWQLE